MATLKRLAGDESILNRMPSIDAGVAGPAPGTSVNHGAHLKNDDLRCAPWPYAGPAASRRTRWLTQVTPDVTAGEYGYDLTYSAGCWPPRRSTACAHVAAAIPNLRHLEYSHDHHRIEHMLFDGALPPDGGALRPDQHRSGLGLDFKYRDAEQYRVR